MSKRTQEEFNTKTQRAKTLYSLLRNEDVISITFTGLVADRIWVADKYKAYHLEDLGNTHLSNIVYKYRRNKEKVPEAILEEVENRLENSSGPIS